MEPLSLATTIEQERFVYQALDLTTRSIRVIAILPGPSDSPISCKLRHVQPTERYACLSYAWGDEHDNQNILINGAPLTVRRNLHDFLKQARKNRTKTFLWIDAICIDQSNVAERNHQVQQMAGIYSDAAQVLVWLGEVPRSLPTIVRTINWIEHIRISCHLPTSLGRFWVRKFFTWNPHWREDIAKVKACAYWYRLWIVQEVLLGNNVGILAGHHLVKYEKFAFAFKDPFIRWVAASFDTGVIQLHPRTIEKLLDASVYADQRLSFQHRPALDYLAFSFSGSRCSETKDHIYGLLGLSRTLTQIEVRYDESDVDTLFRTTLALQPKGKNGEILTLDTLVRVLERLCIALGLRFGAWCGPCASKALVFDPDTYERLGENLHRAYAEDQLCDLILIAAGGPGSIPPQGVHQTDPMDANIDHDQLKRFICSGCWKSLASARSCTVAKRTSRYLLLNTKRTFTEAGEMTGSGAN